MIDMVWQYKRWMSVIELCDTVINNKMEIELANYKRTQAFKQLIAFQIKFYRRG